MQNGRATSHTGERVTIIAATVPAAQAITNAGKNVSRRPASDMSAPLRRQEQGHGKLQPQLPRQLGARLERAVPSIPEREIRAEIHFRPRPAVMPCMLVRRHQDRKSTRLNSSHTVISYAVFCLKKKKKLT